jgi:hypothetical protein
LRYSTALHLGFQSLAVKPLCTATAVGICQTIKGTALDVRRVPGTQLVNDRSGEVIYTPPLLDTTRTGDFEPWIIFMLEAVEATAQWTTDKIAAIRALAEHTTAYVRRRLPKMYSRELVDVIFEQPYCRIGNLVDKEIAGRQAASRYLKELVDAGVLRETQAGKEKLFIHPRLMQLLGQDGNSFAPYP